MSKLRNSGIPAEYTPCETYRGRVIGLRLGLYYAFKGRERSASGWLTRALCRLRIDQELGK